MKITIFENQYFNFWVAYGLAYVGFKLYKDEEIIFFSIFFWGISLVIFIYILNITIKKLCKIIADKKISKFAGVAQYAFELASCFVMCIFLIEMLDVAKKFWKLHLF